MYPGLFCNFRVPVPPREIIANKKQPPSPKNTHFQNLTINRKKRIMYFFSRSRGFALVRKRVRKK